MVQTHFSIISLEIWKKKKALVKVIHIATLSATRFPTMVVKFQDITAQKNFRQYMSFR